MTLQKTSERAVGRWRDIMKALHIPVPERANKHGPCPACGGTDRFRFDDREGRGSWICTHCGAGAGLDLVMIVKKCSFADACKLVDRELPTARYEKPYKKTNVDPEWILKQWRSAHVLTDHDPAALYLMQRGIDLRGRWPSQLRFHTDLAYHHVNRTITSHPAMVALFVSPDATRRTVHATYLDAAGRKADVPIQKRLAPCSIPEGGAVRLAPSADTMGIAEGIETALSATLLHGVPVWAALNSANLMKWQPPQTARNIIICGDHDTSFGGQLAAYSLAYRLRNEKVEGIPRYGRIEVRFPGITIDPEMEDTDWNDQIMAQVGNFIGNRKSPEPA